MALAKCLASPYLTLSRRQSVRPPFAFENHFHVEVPDRVLCLASSNPQVLHKRVQKRGGILANGPVLVPALITVVLPQLRTWGRIIWHCDLKHIMLLLSPPGLSKSMISFFLHNPKLYIHKQA